MLVQTEQRKHQNNVLLVQIEQRKHQNNVLLVQIEQRKHRNNVLLVQIEQRKHQKSLRNLFKADNKDIWPTLVVLMPLLFNFGKILHIVPLFPCWTVCSCHVTYACHSESTLHIVSVVSVFVFANCAKSDAIWTWAEYVISEHKVRNRPQLFLWATSWHVLRFCNFS